MGTNKIIGITLIMIFGLLVLGGILNGTYLSFADKHIGYWAGHFTALAVFLVLGIMFIRKDSKK